MSIAENLRAIRKHIPENVQLVCVSKFHPHKSITEAFDAGERIFGESRVQELTEKHYALPDDIEWHFIGHLQTNKIKFIVPFVSLIHGVDSLKLAEEINKQSAKINRITDCLLQVHIASEETKFGFDGEELKELIKSNVFENLANIRIRGLMGMATFTENKEQIRNEFRSLKNLFDTIKSPELNYLKDFNVLSMGMSDDFQIAIEEGSTMVRIGSSIFGHRQY
jgi:PLP dependent protein